MSFDAAFANQKAYAIHSPYILFSIFSVSYVFYSFFFLFVSPIYTRIESGAISPPPPPPIKGVPLNNNKSEQQDLGEFRILSFRLRQRSSLAEQINSDALRAFNELNSMRLSDLMWRIEGK